MAAAASVMMRKASAAWAPPGIAQGTQCLINIKVFSSPDKMRMPCHKRYAALDSRMQPPAQDAFGGDGTRFGRRAGKLQARQQLGLLLGEFLIAEQRPAAQIGQFFDHREDVGF